MYDSLLVPLGARVLRQRMSKETVLRSKTQEITSWVLYSMGLSVYLLASRSLGFMAIFGFGNI